jgi:hypothetical protein
MKWIRRILLVVLVLALAPVVGLVVHGPVGPLLGGPLFGEVVAEAVEDWSFTDVHGEIQIETHVGLLPYSVTTWCLSHEGRLYVPSRNASAKRWVKQVLADPEAWIRVGGKVYPVRFERVTDPGIRSVLGQETLAKYLGIEAAEVRPVSGPAGPDAPRAEISIFRVESRDAS